MLETVLSLCFLWYVSREVNCFDAHLFCEALVQRRSTTGTNVVCQACVVCIIALEDDIRFFVRCQLHIVKN